MTKTRCAAPLAELSKKAHRSLLCYVPQAWFSADDMDGAADFQLPKPDGARTYVESTESEPIELGAAANKQGFVPVSRGTFERECSHAEVGVLSFTWGKMRSTLGVSVLVQYQVYHLKLVQYQVDFGTYLVRFVPEFF